MSMFCDMLDMFIDMCSMCSNISRTGLELYLGIFGLLPDIWDWLHLTVFWDGLLSHYCIGQFFRWQISYPFWVGLVVTWPWVPHVPWLFCHVLPQVSGYSHHQPSPQMIELDECYKLMIVFGIVLVYSSQMFTVCEDASWGENGSESAWSAAEHYDRRHSESGRIVETVQMWYPLVN